MCFHRFNLFHNFKKLSLSEIQNFLRCYLITFDDLYLFWLKVAQDLLLKYADNYGSSIKRNGFFVRQFIVFFLQINCRNTENEYWSLITLLLSSYTLSFQQLWTILLELFNCMPDIHFANGVSLCVMSLIIFVCAQLLYICIHCLIILSAVSFPQFDSENLSIFITIRF